MADPTETEPKAADPYADHEAILALVKRKKTDFEKGRDQHVRAAYRNLLFAQGQQWIRYDGALGRFRPSILKPGTPTPVTNIFAASMDAVTSVFARIEPRLNFAPGNPEEPEDRAAADVATRAIQVIESETNIRVNRQMLAAWVGMAGGAWIETGYDPDPVHGTRDLQVEQCSGPQCGVLRAPAPNADPEVPMALPCEVCGAPVIAKTETVPVGKMYADVVSLFELFFDPSITDWSKQRAVIREKTVGKDEAESRWKDYADRITTDVVGSGSISEWYAGQLTTMGPELDSNTTARMMRQAQGPLQNRVTEQWYWQLPDATYPEGLLAIVVSRSLVVYAGPLPYARKRQDGGRQPFLPFTFFPQKLVPGSAFPKTVANDLAPKQTQRNKWESILESCGMRVGSPVWMVPNGANVTNFSGEPGSIIRYNATGTPAAKPERVQGQGIPLSFIQRINMIDKEFEQLAATYDVIKGSRPEGVSAGIALQILQERGMSRFATQFILWEASWAEWASQAIEIFREFATEERLLRIKGRDGEWEVQKFLGADLAGRVDVIPEAGSAMPHSTMVERAEIEQLIALGVLNPQDPDTNDEILKRYGKSYMKPSMARDTKNAIMENEAFEALATDPRIGLATADDIAAAREMDYPMLLAALESKGIKVPRVRGAVDDHSVHSREHGQCLKSEKVSKWPELVQVVFEAHKAFHDQLRIAQMQSIQSLQKGVNPQAGFLQQPPAMSQTLNTSSSPARMEGDFSELESQQAMTSQ